MEKTVPKISIIVPVYHVEKYLERCLDSILGQSEPDFELILINDGGTEAETAICEKYAAMDERIIYRRQKNQGLSAARNAGLALYRGEWLMFVDSDDWVHRDFCRNALKAVQ
ncbi:MAG: glycosyltransferase family 2 protein, partial [Solobacterium sp.]|nr:glycosyltransferase family 2 protein [Solobacterium sp.]